MGTKKDGLVPIVFKNIFICVHQRKETHTGLEQAEGEQMKEIVIFVLRSLYPIELLAVDQLSSLH